MMESAPQPAASTGSSSKLPSSWAELQLSAPVSEAVRMLAWAKPTTVQRACIGPVRNCRDVAVQSRTGSGKTGAFVVPMIERIVAARAAKIAAPGTLFALVLVPSAELAEQTLTVCESIAKYVRPRVVIQNASSGDNAASPALNPNGGVDVVVVTAAGLAAGIRNGYVTAAALASVRMLIIDEADLLVASFSMRTIRSALPASFQTVLISATLNDGVATLRGYLHDAITVTLTEGTTLEEDKKSSKSGGDDAREVPVDGENDGGADAAAAAAVNDDDEPIVDENVRLKDPTAPTIEHRYLVATEDCHRHTMLYALLRLKLIEGRTLVFVDDEADTFKLLHFLEQLGISAVVYDASMPVRTRLNTLKRFERGECLVLICTDSTLEAAEGIHDSGANGIHRGIDFFKVRNVIVFDGIRSPSPLLFSKYTHRAGRTGRAQQRGLVITLFTIPQAERGIRQFRDYLRSRNESVRVFIKLARSEAGKLQYRVDSALFNVTRNAAKKLRVATVASEMARNEVLRTQLGEGDTTILSEMVSRANKKLRTDKRLVDVPTYMKIKKADSTKDYEHRVAGRDPLRREKVFNKVARMQKMVDPLREVVKRVRKGEVTAKAAEMKKAKHTGAQKKKAGAPAASAQKRPQRGAGGGGAKGAKPSATKTVIVKKAETK